MTDNVIPLFPDKKPARRRRGKNKWQSRQAWLKAVDQDVPAGYGWALSAVAQVDEYGYTKKLKPLYAFYDRSIIVTVHHDRSKAPTGVKWFPRPQDRRYFIVELRDYAVDEGFRVPLRNPPLPTFFVVKAGENGPRVIAWATNFGKGQMSDKPHHWYCNVHGFADIDHVALYESLKDVKAWLHRKAQAFYRFAHG